MVMRKRNRLATLFFALLFILPLSGLFAQDTIEVSLPDLTGQVGESMTIPVNVADVTGKNVLSYTMTIVYDEDMVNITGYDAAGTLSDGMTITANDSKTDTLTIAAATSSALSGSGVLLNLNAELNMTGTSAMEFSSFSFNEGNPAATITNGSVTVTGIGVSLPDVSGSVGESATIDVMVGTLTDLNVTAYEFTINYDHNVIDITGAEAAGTLSEGMTVTENTGTQGEIRVAAAAQSALSGSGVLLQLNANMVGTGSSALTLTDFTFNEGQPSSILTNGSASVGGIEVSLPSAIKANGSTDMIALEVQDITDLGVTSYEFTLTFDESVLQITGAEGEGTLSEGMTITSNPQNAGEISVAAAGQEVLTGDGTLLYLSADYVGAGSSDVVFSSFMFNEGSPPVETLDGDISVQGAPVAFTTAAPADNDTVMVNGEDLTINWTASSDPEGEDISYTTVLAGMDTMFTTSDTMLTLSHEFLMEILAGGQYAMVDWYVKATDGTLTTMTDTASFTLEKMLPPSTFMTAGPKDTDVLVRSTDEEFTASWHPSDDPNMDELQYTLRFVGESATIPAGSDTMVTITGQDLVDLFITQGLSSAEVAWYVEATDGSALTVSDTASFMIYDVTSRITLAAARIDSDGDYYADKDGSYARVKGTITTVNYRPGGMNYYMQDATAGLNVYSSGVDLDLDIGDEVEIVGEIDQYRGLAEIIPLSAEDVTVVSTGNEVSPKVVGVGSIDEVLEGQLVEIRDVRIMDPDNFPDEGSYGTIHVKEVSTGNEIGVFIHDATDIDGWAEAPTDTNGTWSITGVVDQYSQSSPPSDGYEVRPRMVEDFVRLTVDVTDEPEIPEEFGLAQNFPNPFNPTTTIKYQLPKDAMVNISVYNMAGQKIKSLVNTSKEAGYHQLQWDGTNDMGVQVSSGMYLYRIDAGNFNETRKMLLMR